MTTNRGLSHRFYIKDGKFSLSEGATKAKDCVFFIILFDAIPRIYYPEIASKLLFLKQKPSSFITLYKTLLLGRLRDILLKYVNNISLIALDIISYRANGEKKVEIRIDYIYKGSSYVQDTAVKFI